MNNNNPNDFFEQIFGSQGGGVSQPLTVIKRKVLRRNGIDTLLFETITRTLLDTNGNPAVIAEERHGILDDSSPFDLKIGFAVCSNGHLVHPGNIGYCEICGRKYCSKDGCTDKYSDCKVCSGKVRFGGLISNQHKQCELP